MWEQWNHLYFKKGQALLELAVFGSLLIMLLGILINYALRYESQQRIMQEAFRKALGIVGSTDSASYTLIKDTHIPDPANPWAVGSVVPVSASASVTRNYQMHMTADTVSELPHTRINIQGQEFDCPSSGQGCTMAGFRDEYNVPEGSIDRYKEIFGSTNVWETGSGCLQWQNPAPINPQTGQPEATCLQPVKNVRIIDSCAGEIISYDSAVRQCRQIVDVDACIKECQRGSTTSCSSVCSAVMNPPNQDTNTYDPSIGGAWYCANYAEINSTTHQYIFPILNQLFAQTAGFKSFGPQTDYLKETLMDNQLIRQEGTAEVETTDILNWQDETRRKMVYLPYGSTDPASVNVTEVVTNVNQTQTKKWETSW